MITLEERPLSSVPKGGIFILENKECFHERSGVQAYIKAEDDGITCCFDDIDGGIKGFIADGHDIWVVYTGVILSEH